MNLTHRSLASAALLFALLGAGPLAGCASTTAGSLETEPASCGGVTCARGESCCLLTHQCFDPAASPGACAPAPVPGPSGSDATVPLPDAVAGWDGYTPPPSADAGPRYCTSNSQCAAGEFCNADPALYRDVRYCRGVGRCAARDNGGFCGTPEGRGAPGCEVCGCDGVTYESIQVLTAAGVREAASGPCGVGMPVPNRDGGVTAEPYSIGCATDAQCPGSQRCCPFYGTCYDPAVCPTCCGLPPEGTRAPCMTDAQCHSSQYCAHEGCSGPGGCRPRGTPSNCSGVVEQVCGCDGRTYTNACYAAAEGSNVASTGACR